MTGTIVEWREEEEERELMFYGDYVHRFSHERMNERTVPNFKRGRERENVGCGLRVGLARPGSPARGRTVDPSSHNCRVQKGQFRASFAFCPLPTTYTVVRVG